MKGDKKYTVIVKIGNDQFKKWNVTNLLRFTSFLDREYPNWRWFNVFKYSKTGDGEQLSNFTNKKRPTQKYL